MTDRASSSPAISIGPRVRKSPFFEATRRWGASAYTVYNHMYLPVAYEGPEADYRRLVERVALWDVAGERQVEVTGPDAARFTQLLTPRDLSGCAVGQCRYVLLTDERGGIVNDPLLLKLAEDRFWLSLADADVLLWAKGLARHAGMEVEVGEPDVSPLQVQGPRSPDVMRALLGDWVEDLRYFRFRESDVDGIPVLVSRTGWSSERGYEIFLRDASRGDALWERIMAVGEPFGIGPGAPSAIRRIEGALLSYGADMTLDENPFEMGLERLVNLDREADFVGRAALARIRDEGVARRLVGLEIEGERLPANEHPWHLAGLDPARYRVTSAVWSPGLGRNIALALVPADRAAEGEPAEVETPVGLRPAKVVKLPFVAARTR